MTKRMFILASLAVMLFANAMNAQANEALKCSVTEFRGDKLRKASPRIEDLLDRIVTIGKITQKYTICATPDIENAYATVHWDEQKRVIAYDPVFLDELAKESGDYHWGTVTVLAHEVGHHVSKHIFKYSNEPTLAQVRGDELEADKFAGLVLGYMGASLTNAQALMKTMNDNFDDTTHTHPSGEKRVAAITLGWKDACQQLGKECNDPTMKSGSPATHSTPLNGKSITDGYKELIAQSALLKGKTVTADYCEKYAMVSAKQAQLAKASNCGFNIDKGQVANQWSENVLAQLEWCKKASAYATEKEVKFRENKLSQCLSQ